MMSTAAIARSTSRAHQPEKQVKGWVDQCLQAEQGGASFSLDVHFTRRRVLCLSGKPLALLKEDGGVTRWRVGSVRSMLRNLKWVWSRGCLEPFGLFRTGRHHGVIGLALFACAASYVSPAAAAKAAAAAQQAKAEKRQQADEDEDQEDEDDDAYVSPRVSRRVPCS